MPRIECPYCGFRYRPFAGRLPSRSRCPSCRRVLAVPGFRPVTTRILPAIRLVVTATARRRRQMTLVGLVAALLLSFWILQASRRTPHPDSSGPADPGAPAFLHVPADWVERARETQTTLARELPSDFLFREERPYLLAVERLDPRRDEAAVGEYRSLLPALYRRFREEYGARFAADDVAEVLPVVVFATEATYRAYGLRTHGAMVSPLVTGYFETRTRRLILSRREDGNPRVLCHEAVHQLVHHYLRAPSPVPVLWFHEGIATGYETVRREADGSIRFDDLNRGRLAALRQAEARGAWVPLRELLEISVRRFWDMLADPDRAPDDTAFLSELYYAESWGLIHYLRHGEGGRYREAFDRYVLREIEGRAMPQDALQMIGEDLDGFETKWREYLKALGNRQ